MKMILLYIFLIIGMIPVVTNRCNSKQIIHKDDIEIVVDSVFLNYYKEKKSYAPIYIFFYLRIKNIGIDTISIYLPWSEFDKPLKEQSDFLGVYGKDTIKFYSGCFTPQSFFIYPGETKKVDLQYGTSKELEDLYEEKFKKQFKREQDFMCDIASNSKLQFRIKGVIYTDSLAKRKIIFRDPEDVDDYIWK